MTASTTTCVAAPRAAVCLWLRGDHGHGRPLRQRTATAANPFQSSPFTAEQIVRREVGATST